MKSKLAGLFGLLILGLSACSKENIEPNAANFPNNYFPLEVGYYEVFSVERIDYTLVDAPDSTKYQLKQVVADSFKNQLGEVTYRLERLRRQDPAENWHLDSIWTARISENRLIIVKNNIPFIKLAGNLSPGTKWDGNGFNSYEEKIYRIKQPKDLIEEPLPGKEDSLFKDGVGVLQARSEDTLINRVRTFEIYKKNIGLVYKEYVNLHYCANESCFGLGIIESGTKLQQILIDNGNNS